MPNKETGSENFNPDNSAATTISSLNESINMAVEFGIELSKDDVESIISQAKNILINVNSDVATKRAAAELVKRAQELFTNRSTSTPEKAENSTESEKSQLLADLTRLENELNAGQYDGSGLYVLSDAENKLDALRTRIIGFVESSPGDKDELTDRFQDVADALKKMQEQTSENKSNGKFEAKANNGEKTKTPDNIFPSLNFRRAFSQWFSELKLDPEHRVSSSFVNQEIILPLKNTLINSPDIFNRTFISGLEDSIDILEKQFYANLGGMDAADDEVEAQETQAHEERGFIAAKSVLAEASDLAELVENVRNLQKEISLHTSDLQQIVRLYRADKGSLNISDFRAVVSDLKESLGLYEDAIIDSVLEGLQEAAPPTVVQQVLSEAEKIEEEIGAVDEEEVEEIVEAAETQEIIDARETLIKSFEDLKKLDSYDHNGRMSSEGAFVTSHHVALVQTDLDAYLAANNVGSGGRGTNKQNAFLTLHTININGEETPLRMVSEFLAKRRRRENNPFVSEAEGKNYNAMTIATIFHLFKVHEYGLSAGGKGSETATAKRILRNKFFDLDVNGKMTVQETLDRLADARYHEDYLFYMDSYWDLLEFGVIDKNNMNDLYGFSNKEIMARKLSGSEENKDRVLGLIQERYMRNEMMMGDYKFSELNFNTMRQRKETGKADSYGIIRQISTAVRNYNMRENFYRYRPSMSDGESALKSQFRKIVPSQFDGDWLPEFDYLRDAIANKCIAQDRYSPEFAEEFKERSARYMETAFDDYCLSNFGIECHQFTQDRDPSTPHFFPQARADEGKGTTEDMLYYSTSYHSFDNRSLMLAIFKLALDPRDFEELGIDPNPLDKDIVFVTGKEPKVISSLITRFVSGLLNGTLGKGVRSDYDWGSIARPKPENIPDEIKYASSQFNHRRAAVVREAVIKQLTEIKYKTGSSKHTLPEVFAQFLVYYDDQGQQVDKNDPSMTHSGLDFAFVKRHWYEEKFDHTRLFYSVKGLNQKTFDNFNGLSGFWQSTDSVTYKPYTNAENVAALTASLKGGNSKKGDWTNAEKLTNEERKRVEQEARDSGLVDELTIQKYVDDHEKRLQKEWTNAYDYINARQKAQLALFYLKMFATASFVQGLRTSYSAKAQKQSIQHDQQMLKTQLMDIRNSIEQGLITAPGTGDGRYNPNVDSVKDITFRNHAKYIMDRVLSLVPAHDYESDYNRYNQRSYSEIGKLFSLLGESGISAGNFTNLLKNEGNFNVAPEEQKKP